MNDLAAAVILGLVQGLTEFLPVSSTAHLILVSGALGLDPAKFGLSFDVALHLGTALAVLLYFARTWIELLMDLFARRGRRRAVRKHRVNDTAVASLDRRRSDHRLDRLRYRGTRHDTTADDDRP